MSIPHWKPADPRLHETLQKEQQHKSAQPLEALCRGATVVLVGQRAAGKSTLLPYAARLLGRQAPPVDLDAEIERRAGCSIRHLVERHGLARLRELERAAFSDLPLASVVAVGGGFWSTWPQLLHGCTVVEVPVSFETYRERLLADTQRPRLRPTLSLEEELRQTYAERQALHEKLPKLSWVEFCLRAEAGLRPWRVATLPPGTAEPLAFAVMAKAMGADTLELRTDLHGPGLDVAVLAQVLPLLMARRGQAVPDTWKPHAHWVDVELFDFGKEEANLVSLHATAPMPPEAAAKLWEPLPAGLLCKHVEPLGTPGEGGHLLQTQRLLKALRGEELTTTLAMGDMALPFRCLLAQNNTLDYVALPGEWRAAPGQRLLADAVREARRPRQKRRMGILGANIAHARSPQIHPQPFDRIDLPEGADVAALTEALHPFYSGFAVTSPFKRALAEGSRWPAVNTLVRTPQGWHKDNTDTAGARAVLEALGAQEVVVLGKGGVAIALEEAARQLGVALRFVCAKEAQGRCLEGAVLWTWPTHLEAPPGLRLDGARVALIAYGKPAWKLAQKIAGLGGKPCMLGATWFVAQAREQRRLWERAE
ncbi:MAG: hypothetical protein FWD46_05890 [Cystobacterineae bacterium]|nr:hypothetical protein [Cystobacterineae bacterium]